MMNDRKMTVVALRYVPVRKATSIKAEREGAQYVAREDDAFEARIMQSWNGRRDQDVVWALIAGTIEQHLI